MWSDEIVDEVRAVRQAHAAAHGFDLVRIFEDLRRRQQASGREFVSLPPKPLRLDHGAEVVARRVS